jgi:hypothetical protein
MAGGDGFDEGDPGFFGGGGVVTDAAGDDEELAGVEGHGATVWIGAADGKGAAEDKEHLIFVRMSVPWEVSMDTRYLDVLIVDLADDSRRPKLRKSATGEFKRDGVLLHVEQRLVAEAGGDSDLVAALGAAAAEDGSTGLRGHANEEAVDLGAATAVRLKGALRHRGGSCLRRFVCWRTTNGSGRRASRKIRMQASEASFGYPEDTLEQQVLSISEMRKRGNEIVGG